MSYSYISDESPEIFPAAGGVADSVLLNPHKLKFLLIENPSHEELAATIEQHALQRLEGRWAELLSPAVNNHRMEVIQAFQIGHNRLRALPIELLKRLLGASSVPDAIARVRALTMEEQRRLVLPVKPASIPEMLALYKDVGVDQTGYRYFKHVLETCSSALDFFGKLTDSLFGGFAGVDYRLGNPRLGYNQPRIFEFLGMAAARGWLLFPFVIGRSGSNEVRALLHGCSTRRYLDPRFAPPELEVIMEAIGGLTKGGTNVNGSSN